MERREAWSAPVSLCSPNAERREPDWQSEFVRVRRGYRGCVMTRPYILVVDDEPTIWRTLRANFLARGFDVTAVETGADALHSALTRPPDVVILDLLLPDLLGLDVCRALRADSPVPILVLSAQHEEQIKVRALDLGADDYVTKPFEIDELLARIRALLRRPDTTTRHSGVAHVGPLVVDLDTRRVWRGGAPLDLTPRAFDVLACLLRQKGAVVTHRALLTEIWGPAYEGETQYVWVFVNRLRHKIEDDPAHARYIVTEPGVGYRLVPAPVYHEDRTFSAGGQATAP